MAFPKSLVLLWCALCAALAAGAAPAIAAQAPVPNTVALSKINLVSQDDHETHLQLVVEPRVNGYQALSNNPRDPTIALALTTRTAASSAGRLYTCTLRFPSWSGVRVPKLFAVGISEIPRKLIVPHRFAADSWAIM